MIPKIIHYCWFGHNPLPDSAKKCIASWKKFMPDYEIKEWNEDNFDVNIIPYTSEAYMAKKYAFVSDYARFWILYHFGGLYFDTDVEVIKPMYDIISRGPFMGCENDMGKGAQQLGVAPGLGLGISSGHRLYNEILNIYQNLHFLDSSGNMNSPTIVQLVTDYLCSLGLEDNNAIQQINGIWIYPKEYFCPKDYLTGIINITPQTHTIHHYTASWKPWYDRLERKLFSSLGLRYRGIIERHIVKPLSK